MSEWKPIESAPKDGTCFLVGYDDRYRDRLQMHQRVYEARWNENSETWTSRNGFLLHSDATHWQPLPTPPGEG